MNKHNLVIGSQLIVVDDDKIKKKKPVLLFANKQEADSSIPSSVLIN